MQTYRLKKYITAITRNSPKYNDYDLFIWTQYHEMNSTYLRIIDLSSLAESLDTFCPLYLIMKSPFCNPADAAGEPVKNGVRDSHMRRMAIRNLTRSTDIGTTIHLI